MHGIEESPHIAESRIEGADGRFGTLYDRFEGDGSASAFIEKLLTCVEHAIHRSNASRLNWCITSHNQIPQGLSVGQGTGVAIEASY
jgi:hypothetical protein